MGASRTGRKAQALVGFLAGTLRVDGWVRETRGVQSCLSILSDQAFCLNSNYQFIKLTALRSFLKLRDRLYLYLTRAFPDLWGPSI